MNLHFNREKKINWTQTVASFEGNFQSWRVKIDKTNGNSYRIYIVVYSPYVHTADCQGKDQNWAHFYFNSVPFALYVQTKAKMFPCKAQDACSHLWLTPGVWDVTTDAFLRDLKEVLWSEITEILNSGNSEIMVLLPCWKMPKKLKKKKDGGEKEILSDMEGLTRCPGLPQQIT